MTDKTAVPVETAHDDSGSTTVAAGSHVVTLEADIVVGGVVVHPAGTSFALRRPKSGELRGLTMAALAQLDYAALETLLPRITTPILHKHEVAATEPADLMQFGEEVLDFLLPKAARPVSLPQ